MRRLVFYGAFWLALAPSFPAASADLAGTRAQIIDGDTIELSGTTICVNGIDAPEMGQRCRGGPRSFGPCGKVAADALAELVQDTELRCEVHGHDHYDRAIATCFADGRDIGRAMVRQGMARAFVRYSEVYADAEQEARAGERGLWKTQWQAPWDYRAERWDVAEQEAPEGCPIKGNIGADGDRIYHTPWGSQWYERTRISEAKGERWFCSEREALDAGWRRPLK
jgi:endonuclease YncB( thermonuclease family)